MSCFNHVYLSAGKVLKWQEICYWFKETYLGAVKNQKNCSCHIFQLSDTQQPEQPLASAHNIAAKLPTKIIIFFLIIKINLKMLL